MMKILFHYTILGVLSTWYLSMYSS